ncbi:tetratricopeptide repeat protein [Microbacterium sp. zg.Y843]|nr:tetratricopeptide repeat protein [Microbacterium sp. zg.Y843]
MAAMLIDEDPQLAHEHALAAIRRAGRIAVARETAAITAYAIGDFALALRELRTYRRISGRDDQIALMVDSERGVGRPDRALELGRSVDRAALPTPARVELAIAMSGAQLDLGQPQRALAELDIPELDPDRAFEWSPALFAARATVLAELGRDEESAEWQRRAVVAAEAIDAALGSSADEEYQIVDEVEEVALDPEDAVVDEAEVEGDAEAEPEADAEAEAAASESTPTPAAASDGAATDDSESTAEEPAPVAEPETDSDSDSDSDETIDPKSETLFDDAALSDDTPEK